MTPRQYATLKRTLSLLGRTEAHLAFLYTPAGPDGLPLMVVDAPRIPPKTALTLSQTSKNTSFVRGEVTRDPNDGRLVFQIKAGGAQGITQLIAHVPDLFGAEIPSMATARVVPAP